ncbi:hypothetical protein [Streptomyces cadmiisoli]|uniref:hypothetical protein n=1 Tax=Streptomyces cadmiisoli TaxID=2184053 RepID=UPI003662CCA1
MPTQDDFGQGIDLVSLTDAPDLPKAIKDLADGVIPRGVMRFASASARGATLDTPEEGMVTWLIDSNAFQIWNGSDWVTPEPTLVIGTTGLSAHSGFSVNDFHGARQGRSTSVDMYLTRTGSTIDASAGGNIGDITCATVPTSWRPTHGTINGFWDNGSSCGGFVVGTDGIVTLRTASGGISSGSNLRLHVSFLRTTF